MNGFMFDDIDVDVHSRLVSTFYKKGMGQYLLDTRPVSSSLLSLWICHKVRPTAKKEKRQSQNFL